jgi:hypothetical protein
MECDMKQVEILIKGQIDPSWFDHLSGLVISYTPEGQTILRGLVRDQAALASLLDRIFSIGMQLISMSFSQDSERVNRRELGCDSK